jgi:hypothetical protein
LADIVRSAWRGSGDSRLFAVTWQDNGLPSSYYAQPISASLMRDALTSWHEQLLEKRQTARANVPMSLKAVLLFIYSDKVSVYADLATTFELEHIYPVAYLAETIKNSPEKEEGWPISTLGNLMLIPKDLNRIKGRNLLGDFLPPLILSSEIDQTVLNKTQNYLGTPDWSEVKKVQNFSKDDYVNFCRSRAESLIEEIIQVLSLS